HRHADVLREALVREQVPAGADHRERVGEESLRHEAAQRRKRPDRDEDDEEGDAEDEARRRRDRNERAQRHLMNRVSVSFVMSGSCLMTPISSSRSPASLLNWACSPAKNFWFAARSCQRRYFALDSNCSPLCFTSAPMIS